MTPDELTGETTKPPAESLSDLGLEHVWRSDPHFAAPDRTQPHTVASSKIAEVQRFRR